MIEFRAVVTDIRLESRVGVQATWWMALDETLFVPGDRGALAAETRSGTRLEIAVTGVIKDVDDVIWHVVEKPLAAGTDVVGRIERD